MSPPPIDYRPFERVRDDWTAALRALLKDLPDETIDAFVLITNEFMDALINRAMAATIAAANIVENDALHKEMSAQLRQLQQSVNTISTAITRIGHE